MNPRRVLAAVAAIGLSVSLTTEAGVSTTKHNLSVTGPGTVRAVSETEICVFCHTPHSARPSTPLWNRRDPGTSYTPYSSSTAIASPGQPTGASVLCLSCHDGTIALGDVLSRQTPISMVGGITTMPTGPGRLGTDLSDDHPISFVYSSTLASQSGELVNPSSLTGRVKLDGSGQMQCTSCHDAHDNTFGKFLVKTNSGGALCETCHQKTQWTASAHKTSNKTWNGQAPDPWPATDYTTVAANACQNCHRPHSAGGRERLLNYAIEENNCLACHNGHVAAKNIENEFNKISDHPIANTTGVHDPKEPAVVSSRHVECADCHNPHAARAGAGTSGILANVRGVSQAGTEIKPATLEYQICYRCHADSPGKPAPRTTRQLIQNNVRLEFDSANPSYHPITAPGKNSNVPSLLSPWNTASIMKCTDCHNNNNGPVAGGTGPNGPHGSAYTPILARQYITTDNTSESSSNYALCYNCHNRNVLLSNSSAFPLHNKHVVGERAPCNVCHDPHGISVTQGTITNNSKLINFDRAVVNPSSGGQLRFESISTNTGRCYLSCHGKNHNPCSYGTGMGGMGGMCGMGGMGGG